MHVGRKIKDQPVEEVIDTFANIETKIIKSAIKILFLGAIFVLDIIYRMRSKTFRRKHGKMSRARRGGQERSGLTRQTTAELNAMEEGLVSSATPMNRLGRSNTADLIAMEEGVANPSAAIDVEPTPDIEMGPIESGGKRKGRKTRKTRKGRKTRKARKAKRSQRR